MGLQSIPFPLKHARKHYPVVIRGHERVSRGPRSPVGQPASQGQKRGPTSKLTEAGALRGGWGGAQPGEAPVTCPSPVGERSPAPSGGSEQRGGLQWEHCPPWPWLSRVPAQHHQPLVTSKTPHPAPSNEKRAPSLSPHQAARTPPPRLGSPTGENPLIFLTFLFLEVLDVLSPRQQRSSPSPHAERDPPVWGAGGSGAPRARREAGADPSSPLLSSPLLLKAAFPFRGHPQPPLLTRFLFAASPAGCGKGPSGGSPQTQSPPDPKAAAPLVLRGPAGSSRALPSFAVVWPRLRVFGAGKRQQRNSTGCYGQRGSWTGQGGLLRID